MTPCWRRACTVAAALLTAAVTLPAAGPAGWAAGDGSARIDIPATTHDGLGVYFSATGSDGRAIDLTTATFSATVQPAVKGAPFTRSITPITAQAKPASSTQYVVLAIDNSGSMAKQGKLAAAKQAAIAFLDILPPRRDIKVGLVTFGDPAVPVTAPTDRRTVRRLVEQLTAPPKADTALNGAVLESVKLLGRHPGGGTILLLTDGHNDATVDRTSAQTAQAAWTSKDYRLASVLIGTDAQGPKDLEALGATLAPGVSKLQAVDFFSQAAETFAKQVFLDLPIDAAARGDYGAVTITATVGGRRYTASKPQVLLGTELPPRATVASGPQVALPDRRLTAVTTPVVLAALAALFIALAVLVSTASGVLVRGSDEDSEVLRRLSVYTVTGRQPQRVAVREQTSRLGDSAMARTAVSLMGRVARRRDLERSLDGRLEAAGMPLRTVEWMLLHVAIAVGASLLFLLLSAGRPIAMVLGLVLGLAGPWLFISVRRGRRERSFLAQLPDTLQMLSGSLQAGYTLLQAMDSVVREARPPISVEFNRALIEARLGMPPEDALEGIATRTGSQDFGWVVMAIRIQREVGGNLAELLGTVAETLRERERLRRNVSSLSAEGRLSGAILGLLPVAFTIYLVVAKPDYLQPLFHTQLGLLLIVVGVVLLGVGGVWMSRVVKVEV